MNATSNKFRRLTFLLELRTSHLNKSYESFYAVETRLYDIFLQHAPCLLNVVQAKCIELVVRENLEAGH